MRITKYVLISFILFFTFLSLNLYAKDSIYKSFTDLGDLELADITIEEVVNSPELYHREIITVEGKVAKIEYKRYPNGKKFTLFKLTDDQENIIKVYARGIVDDLADGAVIRIQGRYSKYKKFFFKKYRNVMKARIIDLMTNT